MLVGLLNYYTLVSFKRPDSPGYKRRTGGDPAPDFTAFTADARSVTPSQFQGSPVFVAFWSSWCSRCKEEINFLKELQENYPTVKFVAINSESDDPDSETIQRIEKTIRDWGIPFTVLVDDGLRIWDLYGVSALPTSFIVGSDGTIVFAEPNFYFASPDNFENALLELFDPKIKYSQTESPAE